jgi:peptidoglycan/LPS O-acetylase OafA/YrhL
MPVPPPSSLVFQGKDWTWLIYSHGYVGVWIFFCLSGYLMGKAFFLNRYSHTFDGIKLFWRNRILRIFPLYYFSILVVVAFQESKVFQGNHLSTLWRALTFTYGADATILNPPLWSLSTEVQFYLLIPFIYLLLYRPINRHWKIAGLAISLLLGSFLIRWFFWTIFQAQISQNVSYYLAYIYGPLWSNLDVFLIGFLVNPVIFNRQCASKIDPKQTDCMQGKPGLEIEGILKIIASLGMIGLYFGTAYYLYFIEGGPDVVNTWVTPFLLPPLTAVVTANFIFAFESGTSYERKRQPLSHRSIIENPFRLVEILGVLSYGIYLWHRPILANLAPLFSADATFATFIKYWGAGLLLSMLMATVSYFLVELPAARLKQFPVPSLSKSL